MKLLILQVSVLFDFIGGIVCPGGGGGPGAMPSRQCHYCFNVTDPAACTEIEHCHGSCITSVQSLQGINYYYMGCVHTDHVGQCPRHHHHANHLFEVCHECCDIDMCNSGLCAGFVNVQNTVAPVPATAAPVVTTAAPVVTTTAAPVVQLCHNIETNGFQCSDMDPYNFCTDTSGLAHLIALEKCPLHCGLCRVGDPMPTLPPTTAMSLIGKRHNKN